jgi:hypothetical protein
LRSFHSSSFMTRPCPTARSTPTAWCPSLRRKIARWDRRERKESTEGSRYWLSKLTEEVGRCKRRRAVVRCSIPTEGLGKVTTHAADVDCLNRHGRLRQKSMSSHSAAARRGPPTAPALRHSTPRRLRPPSASRSPPHPAPTHTQPKAFAHGYAATVRPARACRDAAVGACPVCSTRTCRVRRADPEPSVVVATTVPPLLLPQLLLLPLLLLLPPSCPQTACAWPFLRRVH